MYNIFVRYNYKRTLWFKNKVWNKNIKIYSCLQKLKILIKHVLTSRKFKKYASF